MEQKFEESDFIEMGFRKEYCDDGDYYYTYDIYTRSTYDLGLITTDSSQGDWKVYLFPYDDVQILNKADIVNLIDILTRQKAVK